MLGVRPPPEHLLREWSRRATVANQAAISGRDSENSGRAVHLGSARGRDVHLGSPDSSLPCSSPLLL